MGFDKIVQDIANKKGFYIVGIIPESGFQYAMGNVDSLLVHGQEWPSDTEAVIKHSDALITAGGGDIVQERIRHGLNSKKVSVFSANGVGGASEVVKNSHSINNTGAI